MLQKHELLVALLCINGMSVEEAKQYIKRDNYYILGRSGPGKLYLEDAIRRCIKRGGCQPPQAGIEEEMYVRGNG